jgi:hypothetical protein
MCLNETYSKGHTGKHLSKEGDALLPLLFNFALEYTIRKIQESQVGLNLNETNQLLPYPHEASQLGDNRYHNEENWNFN